MDNLEHSQVFECVEKLDSESADQVVIEAIKIVDLQKFEQIHGKEFEADAQVLPKHNIVIQMDHVHDIVGVIFLKELQNLEFDSRLIVILFLVFYHFKRHFFSRFVVCAQDAGAEGPFPKKFLNLVPEPYMIMRHDLVITFFVIVAKVVLEMLVCLHLLRGWCPYEVNYRVV